MVRLEKVSKVYQRGATSIAALRGVSLEVPHGQFLALMGPSGSGKSTLLNLISGLDRPTEGEIMIDGRSTHGFSESDWTLLRRERLGIVFQFFNLLPGLTAQENVELPLLLSGDPQSQEQAEASLRAVGMAHRAGHRPAELSGGERQRVMIARALAQDPRVLLLDEPTAFLDLQHQIEICSVLNRLKEDRGLTVVLVSHDLNVASEYCDRLMLLDRGQVFRLGTPDDVIQPEVLEAVYRCQVLVDRHPRSGLPRVTLPGRDTASA